MKNTLKSGLLGAFLATIVLSLAFVLLPSLSSSTVSGADGFTNRLRSTTPADALSPVAPVEHFGFNSLYNGATWDRQRTPKVFKVVALGAGTTETTIWTPTSGKKFRLMGFILSVGAASTLTFKDDTGGTSIFAARGAADAPIVVNLGNGILSGAANRVLTVTRGTSATLDGTVFGTEE
ncbi:MAG: hypothetical protein HY231_23775 [Acidobacteria bacterium]|nr:hypothetical protein [Acidobacteriota bacterium]